MYIRNKLKGPIFSIITPFDKKGAIDYLSLKNYLKYLYSKGATNFYVMAYNSRLTLLTEREILEINLFCIKLFKNLNKKNLIICAEPYHCSTEQSIKYINFFSKKGADLVSVFWRKILFRFTLYNHFKLIHDKTSCLLLLHQQPLENGISTKPLNVHYS